MEVKEKLNISVPKRIKRRVKEISEDNSTTMNDVILEAINDYIDRLNAHYTAPDLILDRMNQLFVSQMAIIEELNKLNEKVDLIDDRI